jgi:hypothetical protein
MRTYMKFELGLFLIGVSSGLLGHLFHSVVAGGLWFALLVLCAGLMVRSLSERTKAVLAFFAGAIFLVLLGMSASR